MLRKQLVAQIFGKKSFLCVGLDPELSKLPSPIPRTAAGILTFNKAIVDATRDLCVAYKPNLAFYEALGPAGWEVLSETIAYIGSEHLVIADAKRGDIGNTGRLYAEAFFQQLAAGAVTVAPYMGRDSVEPFLQYAGKWAVVLGLTSNAGSADFQQQTYSDGTPLWETVIRQCQAWGTPENLMFVVGATHPEAFARVRQLAPDHFLLVPGVGAQGGDLAAICRHGLNSEVGLLVNASRSILYASGGGDFAERARGEAGAMREEMAEVILGFGF